MPNFDPSVLPWVEFARPWLLAAIPPLLLFCGWVARGRLGGWQSVRSALALTVRCIVVVLLVGAIAEPHVIIRSSSVATILVRDRSASVPAPAQGALDQFLSASLARRNQSDRVGLVTAAAEPMVAAIPRAQAATSGTEPVVDRSATDLAGALMLAGAIAPPDAGTRILLASDGNQTRGDVLAAARALAARGIPVDSVVLPADRHRRVAIEEVLTPTWARPGSPAEVRIVLRAGRAAQGRLSLTLNDEPVDLSAGAAGNSKSIALDEGLNVLSIPVQLSDQPVQRFRAAFEPDNAVAEDDPRGLSAEAVTFVQTRGRVLVVSDAPDAVARLLDAVRSDEVVVDTVPAAQFPGAIEEMAGYDAILLFNQSAGGFSQAQQTALRAYVHDAAGGLVMIGGPDSFGAGGWISSPLAEALPIVLDPPQKRQLPMGALAIIIDCSGSMGAPVAGTTLNQQTIANDAAVLGIRTLSRLDDVTVIAFSDMPEVVVPLRRCTDPEKLGQRIRSIIPTGGTNLFPAIDAAAAELAKSAAGLKHIIILTDGETVGDPADGFAKAAALRRRNVTLSTVVIGDAANSDLLRRLAQLGGGQCYPVRSENAKAVLPQIFVKEAQLVRRSLIWEGPAFSPTAVPGVEALRGLSGPFPAITGYVVAADRGGLSSIALRGPENDPILAQWQHGLGRVTTYTSDASPRWNAAWINWPGYSAFWRQQLQWVMRPLGDVKSRLTMTPDGSRTNLVLELFDADGDPLNFATVRGRAINPAGDGSDITLKQVGPGRYTGAAVTRGNGAHVINVRYDATAGSIAGVARGAVVNRSTEELAAASENAKLMTQVAAVGNGRVYRLDAAGADLWPREGVQMPMKRMAVWLLFAAAALTMFVLDVAVRRISFEPGRFVAGIVVLLSPSERRGEVELGGLAAARARAQARMSDDAPPSELPPDAHQAGEAGEAVKSTPAAAGNFAPAPPTAQDEEVLSRLRRAKHRAQNRE